MKNAKSVKEKAGVIVYRYRDAEEASILIVSARKSKNQWVFPVGSVEKGESLKDAARRECEEESGYIVEIGNRLPSIHLSPEKGTVKRFTFFLATVVGEVDLWETDRQRKWVSVSKVVQCLPDVFQRVAVKAIEQIRR